jgi:uncharacterized membrane protein
MNYLHYIYLYLLTVPVFFAIDMVWLGVMAKSLYQNKLGYLLGPVQWFPAIVFYLLYIAGILIFATIPALETASLSRALIYGALFGFFAYATYDLTNLATIKGWPLSITLIDILWGVFLTGSVATISYLLGKSLFY